MHVWETHKKLFYTDNQNSITWQENYFLKYITIHLITSGYHESSGIVESFHSNRKERLRILREIHPNEINLIIYVVFVYKLYLKPETEAWRKLRETSQKLQKGKEKVLYKTNSKVDSNPFRINQTVYKEDSKNTHNKRKCSPYHDYKIIWL